MYMHNKRVLSFFIIGLFIGGGILPIVHTDNRLKAECMPIINLPINPVIASVETFPQNWNSSFRIELTGIDGPYDVMNGTYHGWCVEYGIGTTSAPITVLLNSSYDPPAHLSNENWSKVNYILNHKEGDRIDVQRAIWYFVNFGPWDWDHFWGPYSGPISNETWSMIENALLYGDEWCPEHDDIIAVICNQGENWPFQLTFIEITLIVKNIIVVKSVHYNSIGPWDDTGITIDLSGPNAYDWCTFRINVTNIIDVPLNVTVKDVLPEGLINGNHYYPFYADFHNDSTIIWYLDGVHHDLLQPGQTMSFALRVEMGECEIQYMNYVYVTSQFGSSSPIEYSENAYVEWINCPQDLFCDINQSVFDRGFPIHYASDGDWTAAQSFIPTVSILTNTEIYIRRFGNSEFDLVVELRENHPQGTLIDTIVFTPLQVSYSWDWLTLDFDDLLITPGIQYFIVCSPGLDSSTNSFGYEWGYAYGNHYDDGSFWFTRNSEGLWRDLPAMYDFTFRIYGFI